MTACNSSTENRIAPEETKSVLRLFPASADFPNAGLLVSSDSLQSSLGAENLIVIDARTSGYETSHIPGAVNLKYGDYRTSSGLKPVEEIESDLGAAGISPDKTIAIYDNTTGSWGASGRIFWMLEFLGCKNVHVLDGGWDKWLADGRPVSSEPVTLPAATFTAAADSSVKMTTRRLSQRLYDNDFAVIDSRTDEEFMGWQLYGETRGGHIPGSVQIPYAWFFDSDKTTPDYQSLKTMFESRGITIDKEVSAYCTVGIRSGYVYFLLRLMGYSRISNYDASIVEWASNPDLPMEKAPRFSTVVHPAWVNAVMEYHKPGSDTEQPPEYPYDRSHKFLIFETQWGSLDYADDYNAGHIPGAVHSDSDIYENGFPRWFMKPEDELHEVMRNMGITADTTVIVYSSSPIFAARLWWILTYAGVADVRYLNGGFSGWEASGYPVETAVNSPVPAGSSAIFTVRPEYLATTDYVETVYATDAVWLTDVRSGSEYAGVISGYSYLAAKGRIPNAVWANDADDSSLFYNDSDGTLRSYTDVRTMWQDLGISSDRELIFYCGSGYRSSLTFLYAYLMGFDNVRNYSDGWEGWSTQYTYDPEHCIKGENTITQDWCQEPSGRPAEQGMSL